MPSAPGRLLIPAAAIRRRVRELAAAVAAAAAREKKPLTVLALLNGSVFFLVDLVRHLPPETRVECWRVQSYAGTKTTGKVSGLDRCGGDFKGRHVVIIDDILDTGLTLDAVTRRVAKLGAARIDVCVLLRKRRKRTVAVRARWAGFEIGDAFVIGYGLDHDGQYRGLNSIRVLDS